MSASRKKVCATFTATAAIAVMVALSMQDGREPASARLGSAAAPSGPIVLVQPGDEVLTPGVHPASADPRAPVHPVIVNMADVPRGMRDANSKLDRWLRGEVDFSKSRNLRSEDEINALREASLNLAPAPIESFSALAIAGAPAVGVTFDSIDYTECCGGGGNVPPDPELAAGPNHLIAVVNVALEIYDKTGTSLAGPITFASLFAATPACSTSVFDPNVIYDEKEDRFVLAIDGNGASYCVAASTSGDPTGTWNTYAFAMTANAFEFFDYPHAGVGEDAVFVGANIFFGNSFLEGRVWALDKMAMYAGAPAASLVHGLGFSEDTPQPMNLHGWNQGTWPTDRKHYFLSATNFNGATHTLWAWDGPFSGPNTFASTSTINLDAASGVVSGFPVSAPQSGGASIQANDWRPLDFEYRNGFAWTAGTIACNPGGGTVDCIRWAQIDLAGGTIGPEGAGVAGTPGDYRFFPDLAVNDCGDMAIGYTKTSASTVPGIWYSGRESTDSPGTLQPEAVQRAGDVTYTAFDPPPHRWGDYTGMTIDPDGVTFWYLGEFSKNTGTTQGRWGTNIGSFTFAQCATGTTGACCLPDGACSITAPTSCTGTYQGDETLCDPNTCPPPATGACCAPDGACTIDTINHCADTYLGDDTVCVPNTCPLPATGACCAVDGSCTIDTIAACTGSYQGDGTLCVPNTCPLPPVGPSCSDIRRLRARCNEDSTVDALVVLNDETHDGETVVVGINGEARVATIVGRLATHTECCPQGQLTVTLELPANCVEPVSLFCGTDPTGACCAPDGSCATTSAGTCTDDYQGDGTSCTPNLCPQPPVTGACCAPDGTCTEATGTDCPDMYQGDGTSCTPNLCPQPPVTGACCAPDGTCTEATGTDCPDMYQGDGTSCTPNLCPQPPVTGACCAPDGTCNETAAADCPDTYQGDGTSCTPNLCPQPATGACCAIDGSCTVETDADCDGTYQGDDTVCIPNNCPPPPIGPSCADIRRLRARCNDDGTTEVLVVLEDTTHSGETVTVSINGTLRVLTIVGRFASHTECCPQGELTIALELPGGCVSPVVISCGP